MQYNTVRQVYFSPAGTTRTVTEKLVNELTTGANGSAPQLSGTHDLLRKPLKTALTCAPDELLVVSVPVFAGRIPVCCEESLGLIKGRGGPAVAVVLYGNRAYEDALLELVTLLEGNGFVVGAAGAFVGRHSIIQDVGIGRPDAQDMALVADFARRIREKTTWNPVAVPGDVPFKERKPTQLMPSFDGPCSLCGACVRSCPTKALRVEEGRLVKDAARCVACTACISVCPEQAHAFRGGPFEGFRAMFVEKFSARKEPELFV